MRFSKLINTLNAPEIFGYIDCEISGISHDSRQIKDGFIFVAIDGHKLDGNSFVPDAVRSGAVVIVTEKYLHNLESHIVQVIVPNTRKALSSLSSSFFGAPSKKIKVIGVTGTNGKTTTTYLIKSILESANRTTNHTPDNTVNNIHNVKQQRVGLLGTIKYCLGNKVLPAKETTPESVVLHDLIAQMVDMKIDHVVMEVSSQGLVQHRTDDIEFCSAVFTNLTPEHLDYHRDFSAYRDAKAILFRGLSPDSFAVLNADDNAGKFFSKKTRANVVWYGIRKNADVRCTSAEFSTNSSKITVSYHNKEVEMVLPLIGLHNVYNALAAIANSAAFGIDLETARDAICKFNNVPGRLESIDCGQRFKVYVDYAHTAHALEATLESLKQSKSNGNRILLVFGCGGDRDKGKRPEMGMVAARLADKFWITNDNPRSEDPSKIISDIEEGLTSESLYIVQPERRLAITEAITEAKEKDIVLIAGKGHETGQIIGNNTYRFNDKEIASEILNQFGN